MGIVNGILRDPQYWDPFPILFPYHSHKNPERYGNGMGIVWEVYHKGVPLLGVPEITLEIAYVASILKQIYISCSFLFFQKEQKYKAVATQIF